MALALVRYGFRGRALADLFVFLPLATPEVVLGAALLALFLTINVTTGFVTIVIAHVMFNVSYVVVTVKARLEGMDRHIEEAAMDLGATEWTTFRKVTLPMIAPGVAPAGAAGRRALDRRLRDHELQRRPDADVPAVHLRRHAPGRAAARSTCWPRAAARRARADGAQRAAQRRLAANRNAAGARAQIRRDPTARLRPTCAVPRSITGALRHPTPGEARRP